MAGIKRYQWSVCIDCKEGVKEIAWREGYQHIES